MLILENAKLQKSLLNERALLKAENSNIILWPYDLHIYKIKYAISLYLYVCFFHWCIDNLFDIMCKI